MPPEGTVFAFSAISRERLAWRGQELRLSRIDLGTSFRVIFRCLYGRAPEMALAQRRTMPSNWPAVNVAKYPGPRCGAAVAMIRIPNLLLSNARRSTGSAALRVMRRPLVRKRSRCALLGRMTVEPATCRRRNRAKANMSRLLCILFPGVLLLLLRVPAFVIYGHFFPVQLRSVILRSRMPPLH